MKSLIFILLLFASLLGFTQTTSIVTELYLANNFTPKSGITPGSNNTQGMDCDQITTRYNVTISGITSTGARLPSQNELTSAIPAPTFTQITFPNGVTSTKIIVETSCNDNGYSITERGIWYNTTSATPTGTKVNTSAVAGYLSTDITGLTANTTYYFTAFATNAGGTTYYPFASGVSTMPALTSITTSQTWICPSRCNSVTIECYGGGGAGGGATGTASRAGGGAGGSYAKSVVSVTPGNSYTVTIGAGGVASTTVTRQGGNTSFTTLVVANGGAGAATTSGTNGTGATAVTTGSVGTTIYQGGSGGNGTAGGYSGGGGGAAATYRNGISANLSTAGGGIAPYSGGGGAGVNVANTRNNGSVYGGGGSGGLSSSTTDRTGGNGAAGLMIITYP